MTEDDRNDWGREVSGLADLLAAERSNVTAPADAEERLWGSIAGSLAGGAIGGGSGGGGSGGGGAGGALAGSGAKVVAALHPWIVYALGALSGVVGTVAVVTATSPRAPSIVPASSIAFAGETIPIERDTAPPGIVAALTATADASKVSAPRVVVSSHPSASPSAESTFGAERAVLDEARAALGRQDGEGALRHVDAYARRYPQGQFGEEREAIAIQALLLTGRYDDARQREALFEKQYPHSMILQAVRASIQSIP